MNNKTPMRSKTLLKMPESISEMVLPSTIDFTSDNYFDSRKGRSPLLVLSVISSHLKFYNYPENSLSSALKCGSKSGFKALRHCSSCGDTHLVEFKHNCSLRTCPDCSEIRQRKLKKRFLPLVQNFSTKRGSLKSLYFLTISPHNYPSLEYGFQHIKETWRKFIRTKYIKERVDGGLWILETKNTGKGWHIHIHALFYGRRLDNAIRGKCNDCGQNFMRFDKIKKRHYCSNRNCNSLDVIVNKNSKIVNLFEESGNRKANIHITEIRGGSRAALGYCLKYVSSNKDEFSCEDDFAEYVATIRKQKLINTFGNFFKFKVKKELYSCNKCGGDVDFIVDQAVIYEYERRYGTLKPPEKIWF